MELSAILQGSHAVASPSGNYLAFITNGKLRICAAHAPERISDITIRIPARDVQAVRWNEGSSRLSILSAKSVEVVSLDDASHRVRLDNGSGGLGRFVCADFVGADQLLVICEFGKAKLWDLATGKGCEIADVKTVCSGDKWQCRPGDAAKRTLATLERRGADDLLNIYFPALQKQLASVKLATTDAQALSWSPDGRWIAVLDTPTSAPAVHFHTPDGHRFRSYPATSTGSEGAGLGVKSVVWSPDGRVAALAGYDGSITLLNTRTFTPLATIEHTTTIDQRSMSLELQAPIWQEAVSASGERSYSTALQPFSPPLSRAKSSTVEPSELGVAEARFSCDGSYLATRDERMLNTVWIWNMATLAAHAVLVQHSNVRKMHWHPSRPDGLMLDCGEGIAYLFDASSSAQPPTALGAEVTGSPTLCWAHTAANSTSIISATTKSSVRLLYPDGRPVDTIEAGHAHPHSEPGVFDEGASEDSLFEALSGRKPLPEQSYTERVDLETEEEDTTTGMDDTFVEKKRSRRPVPVDPLDDSQIF